MLEKLSLNPSITTLYNDESLGYLVTGIISTWISNDVTPSAAINVCMVNEMLSVFIHKNIWETQTCVPCVVSVERQIMRNTRIITLFYVVVSKVKGPVCKSQLKE